MANQATLRIAKEITDLQNGSDLSLAVAFQESNIRRVKALIIGPPGTPYEFGFFEFTIKFGKEYPQRSPDVRATTTNGGYTRFNPNVYASGKVCLSILGTWRGEPGEEWSSAQGLESVLLSIQSLLSPNPYENEPGFESSADGRDEKEAKAYAAKVSSAALAFAKQADKISGNDQIYHETLRISVVKRLEDSLNIEGPLRKEGDGALSFGEDPTEEQNNDQPWEPFIDICKRRFLWYYNTYLQGIEDAIKKNGKLVKDGVAFKMTPFEADNNGMKGEFEYKKLRERLTRVRTMLDEESEEWVTKGILAFHGESPVALLFQNTFKALVEKFKNSDTPLDLELVDQNPFVWRIVMFGRPMTNLDGGVFKIKLVFPTSFPQEQPRVTVETPMFHHRVSTDGILCYFPAKAAEVCSHIEGIIDAIQDESPRYDPRAIVNPEAATLLWGTTEQKKMYNRKLRRSAQESSEY